MNVFCTDIDPGQAARNLCDVHLRKMLIETAQMLCTAARQMGEPGGPYDDVSRGHKCTLWVQQSRGNWDWLVQHGLEMNREYMRRAKRGHRAFIGIMWASRQDPPDEVFNGQTSELTPFADAIWPKIDIKPKTPEEAVAIYRGYYGRKEEAWAILARAQALAYVAAGKGVKKGQRPIMTWVDPGSRPTWMPETAPGWVPSDAAQGEAEVYGHNRRGEMNFALKQLEMDHRVFFIELATQDFEHVDVDVAKELIKLAK